MKKTTALFMLCFAIGYWVGNLFTNNRLSQDAQEQIDSLTKDRKLYFQQIQACEQQYTLLKNGDVAQADKMEKNLDNGSGW